MGRKLTDNRWGFVNGTDEVIRERVARCDQMLPDLSKFIHQWATTHQTSLADTTAAVGRIASTLSTEMRGKQREAAKAVEIVEIPTVAEPAPKATKATKKVASEPESTEAKLLRQMMSTLSNLDARLAAIENAE